MRAEDLLHPTQAGLYCPPADVYVDPIRPVARALVTHGHADHARAGHGAAMATRETLDIMALRYGEAFTGARQPALYGETVDIGGGVRVSFHPAGHVLGSAQILVEAGGLRICVTGDYKRGPDPSSAPYELVPADVLITEATFGLPVFRHPEPEGEVAKLLRSLEQFPERAHLVGVYALGKAQRLIALLRAAGYQAPIYIHGALAKLCAYYEAAGVPLGRLESATVERGKKGDFAGAIVLGPPSAFAAKWAQRFPDPLIGFASGWMQVRARAKQRGTELPLVISDHCDWDGLCLTIRETAPQEVWVTHGREEALVRWCELEGVPARPLNLVGYEDEAE